ncbi:MAG: cytochrome c oxidase accessory protein CcoG [Cycloclasticus sp.]|nr:cytochrome c oxidase accessory protein CcoG [Cycloclasticus sp.]
MTNKNKDSSNSSLFKERSKIHPREVEGLFVKLRYLSLFVLLGMYYLLPWISINEQQIVLFDLPARKFYIFGWVFWPQDFIYLSLLLICAAFSLFLFTALAGRLWCGYACPQTVWTEVFLWIERKIEGTRSQQIKLDKAKNSFKKIQLKATKHIIWVLFALFTGFTFVGFFTPIKELTTAILGLQLGPWETFWLFFYSLATYANAGWLREQVCLYMCPYARFQSVMLDKDTLVISYDALRGEPRGGRKKGIDFAEKGLGSCIDCNLCVQVCPTGIDIRNGLQYECIGCAACIDVCDDVMEKMSYPKGLITYTTENKLEGQPSRILRPRIIVYITLLVAILSGVIYSIETRDSVALNVLRDRNSLYRENPDGSITNSYTIKVLNMDKVDHHYAFNVSGIDGIDSSINEPILVRAGQVLEAPVSVFVQPESLKTPSSNIIFSLHALEGIKGDTQTDGRFIGPLDP